MFVRDFEIESLGNDLYDRLYGIYEMMGCRRDFGEDQRYPNRDGWRGDLVAKFLRWQRLAEYLTFAYLVFVAGWWFLWTKWDMSHEFNYVEMLHKRAAVHRAILSYITSGELPRQYL